MRRPPPGLPGIISRQQFGHPPVVVRGDFYDPQFVGGDLTAGPLVGEETGLGELPAGADVKASMTLAKPSRTVISAS
jgi:hypothetical protein